MDPLLIQARENVWDWQRFTEGLPKPVYSRIKALVCDNFSGAKRWAGRNNWTLQLCHAHLIRQLQIRRGRWKHRIPGTSVRESIYQLIRTTLELPESPRLEKMLKRLNTIQKLSPSVFLGRITREYLRSAGFYRAYLHHPELELPTTTNTLESMAKKIRDLMRRTNNLRTPKSLGIWVTGFIRINPKMVCNGRH